MPIQENDHVLFQLLIRYLFFWFVQYFKSTYVAFQMSLTCVLGYMDLQCNILLQEKRNIAFSHKATCAIWGKLKFSVTK